uniref:Uncharacterized protein n=1 Tax=Triticum urartu TaxID=4572 RepID=A0A8R7U1T8_TRIUA
PGSGGETLAAPPRLPPRLAPPRRCLRQPSGKPGVPRMMAAGPRLPCCVGSPESGATAPGEARQAPASSCAGDRSCVLATRAAGSR